MKRESEDLARAFARKAFTPQNRAMMEVLLRGGATYQQFREAVEKVLDADAESRAAINTLRSLGVDPEDIIKAWFEEVSRLTLN